MNHDSCVVCNSLNLEDFLIVEDYTVSGEEFPLVKCNDCGIAMTQTVPTEEEIGSYYKSDDYISHSDTQEGLMNSMYHKVRKYMLGKKSQIVSDFTGLSKGSLLDIGCGTGYFGGEMTSKGWSVMGLEPSPEARLVAVSKFGLQAKDPSELYKLEAEKFDAVTMWHVLEHVHKLNEYLQTIHKVLKPGGLLLIAVPNHESFDAKYYKKHWAAYDVPRHLWHFTPNSMNELVEKHGFTIEKHKRMPFDAFYVSLLSEKYRNNKLALLMGGLIGKLSWINSWSSAKKCSSVIYLCRKN
ncbi:MAG: 2-polyprenyl-3-methyl-5-hydroxy-6-metoxy-1,4-benzoquinol methylase [Sphingobacteriales bacterium]|jgi:2-polyprenyl-3-methyl-5-hydroxy-6-metoxy-1,4-benzoquinol methylase